MRRLLVALFIACWLLAGATAAGADTSTVTSTAAPVAQSSSDGGSDPSIIGSPDPTKGSDNIGGLVVGLILLGGWVALGAGLYAQARRKKARAAAAVG